ncbi:MAG TPA: DNA mismatch repair protein MutS [Thermoanaerobaculia bacterium]
MKALLMHRDRDFDARELPWNQRALVQDLELPTLLAAMARGDKLVHEVALKALLTGCRNDPDTILYRQAIARDALANPAALRELYGLTWEALESKRKSFWGVWGRHPSSVLFGATEMMQMFAGMLRRLRGIARAHAASFASEGFTALFGMLERELTDEYLARVEAHLAGLRFRGGVLISAELGPGNAGRRFVLREPHEDRRPWLRRVLARDPPGYTYRVPDRDEAGAQALSDLRDRGIDRVANALAQSADHVESFLQLLRAELAFYVGCLNLHESLAALAAPTCFPWPSAAGQRRLRCRGLYDPCLALQMQRRIVGNGVDAGARSAVIVTGANQGGKSSFLRAVGVAQLAMQCGMFAAAESFDGELCTGLVTHYKREEDATLERGKLDEELARMSEIVDHLAPNAMVLLNESFAATNEREGSEIARQVVSALLEKGIKVFFVTHLHAFAHRLFETAGGQAAFLRAERLPDGTRTFRLVEGEPLATSYGRDLYERIFAAGA